MPKRTKLATAMVGASVVWAVQGYQCCQAIEVLTSDRENSFLLILRMGQSASRATRQDASKGILITLDALGTIYKFKKPIGEQYVDVAKSCGLNLHADDVTRAFRSSYKSLGAEYPNYGKGKLASSEVWWTKLTTDTFRQFGEIPADLPPKLYRHFTTNNAYELFPDVKPFLHNIRNLRRQLGPIIIGVITNSDPRVHNVLESLGVNVGEVQHASLIARVSFQGSNFTPPWHNAYNINRDFDFLTTSYEAGSEKPSPGIFLNAQKQASVVMLSRESADIDYSLGLKSMMSTAKLVKNSVDRVTEMQCIHVGDELVKDYDGAKNFGFDALLLDRERQHEGVEGRVGSLEEVATVIALMAQEGLKDKT